MTDYLLNVGGPAFQVEIELLRNPNDSTLYDWSFGQPEGVDMGIGTYCSVITETHSRSIYHYLFEEAKERLQSIILETE